MSSNLGYFFLKQTLHRVQLQWLILTWDFPHLLKVDVLFLNLSSSQEPRGRSWCLLMCRTLGRGEIAAPTRLPLVKQMRAGLDWWSDWSPGWAEFFPRADAHRASHLCMRLCRCLHLCVCCKSSCTLLHSVFQRSVPRVQKSRSARPPESQSECYGLPCQRHSAGQSIIALQVTVRSVPGFKCQ